MMKTTITIRRPGFTLVELLVVIAIIGILMSMALPAIQSARESGRRTQCKNNLRNIVQAANNHLAGQKFFPSGGWGYGWSGEPDRGFGMTQSGSWLYSILPYIEEQALYDLGKGLPDTEKKAAGAKRMETPVAAFRCPTRNRPELIEYKIANPYEFKNVAPRPAFMATSDYAGCGGDAFAINAGPGGNTKLNLKRSDSVFSGSGGGKDSNGIMSSMSEWKPSHVLDGLSKTIFAGERWLYYAEYNVGSGSDDSGWTTGYDHDTIRWTDVPANFDNTSDYKTSDKPHNFGSAHLGGMNVAMCDGAVATITYEIDLNVFRQLGNRKDGGPSDLSMIQQ